MTTKTTPGLRDDVTLTFVGGAGSVTGSKCLIRSQGRQFLLDCGLFQGLKNLRLRNWVQPPFDPRELDAVVLSRGHLDHSGYLPLLAKQGYRGPVFCTSGTRELIGVVLRDSAYLQATSSGSSMGASFSRSTIRSRCEARAMTGSASMAGRAAPPSTT